MTIPRTITPLLLLATLMAVAACAETREPDPPEPSASSLMEYLDEVDYRENWNLWPGLGEKYSAREPHGALITTYLNPLALDALMGKKGTMPEGAIIVKENYTSDGKFEAHTVMYKKAGFNPDHNNWFWLKVLEDGTIKEEGRSESCLACHGQVEVNDYVWSGPLF